jgi:hypothetical protein
MTRFPIKLEDRHTRQGSQRGRFVEASLCLDVPAAVIEQTVGKWKPIWEAGIERRHPLRLPPLENEHWDWLVKSSWLSLAAYRSLGVECEGVMQGLMMLLTDGYAARMEPDIGKPLVYVDYVQNAPWSNQDLVDRPRFGAVGSHLLDAAVKLSVDLEYGGRLGLHSLQNSEGFYHRLGLTAVEIERQDRHARGLWYFEFTRAGAKGFLQTRSSP